MEPLLRWVSQYGYAGLFGLLVLGIVGLPVPDETLLVFSGYLISIDRLRLIPTLLSGFGGTACGISLSYMLGRGLGVPVVQRYGKYVHLTPERLVRVHQWFERTGDWLLAIGYFIPGVRHFTALVAGMSGLEYGKFALFAYSGGATWVAVFVGIGYFVGEKWRSVLAATHRYIVIALILAFAVAAIAILVARRRRLTGQP